MQSCIIILTGQKLSVNQSSLPQLKEMSAGETTKRSRTHKQVASLEGGKVWVFVGVHCRDLSACTYAEWQMQWRK